MYSLLRCGLVGCCLLACALPVVAQDDSEVQIRARLKALDDFAKGGLGRDRLAREHREVLKRILTEKAQAMWTQAGLESPLLKPLNEKQLEVAQLLVDRYRDTEPGRLAEEILKTHRLLVGEPEARALLDAIQYDPDVDITSDQAKRLLDFIDKYPDTTAAAQARQWLENDRARRDDRELKAVLAQNPVTPETAAEINKYAMGRVELARTLVDSQRLTELELIIKAFPDSQAARQAEIEIVKLWDEVESRAAVNGSRAATSAALRRYWDSVYPQRAGY